ncbi:hypothetical protein [Streptomyces sp. NPDC013457]|uniref:hypothetical protein n=1 Tax=Streptomyces sp. NPDC013457 TaxID=3364866 RepID=UPI0037016BD1
MYAHTTWPPPGGTYGATTSAPGGTSRASSRATTSAPSGTSGATSRATTSAPGAASGASVLAARRAGMTAGRWGR